MAGIIYSFEYKIPFLLINFSGDGLITHAEFVGHSKFTSKQILKFIIKILFMEKHKSSNQK